MSRLPSRRLVARWLGALAALAAAPLWWRRTRADRGRTPAGTGHPQRPPRWGMVIDLDRCTGCTACAVACRAENNVPVAGPEQSARGRQIHWMDLLTTTTGGYPEGRTRTIPTPCNHCDDPACIKVCPVGATYRNDEGIVAQIWARCIGCRYCTVACPYGRRYFNWTAPAWTPEAAQQLNPDVATRPAGVVEKCTFCHHRIRAARALARRAGRALTDADVRRLPACAECCPTGAITFGDLDDPDSAVARLARSPRATRLLEELGTEPKVYYLREERWSE